MLFFFLLIFSVSCSSSYKELTNSSFITSDKFSQYLLEEYHKKADFEAKKMHDWNSAKLYSEKALLAVKGVEIKPQKINHWKIPEEYIAELQKAFDNLMNIYSTAIVSNPRELAIAISSLDCWAEQQEENWQALDIKKCKNDYMNAMHNIFNSIKKNAINVNSSEKENFTNESVSVVTKDENNEILQIIYFAFDKSELTEISLEEIRKIFR